MLVEQGDGIIQEFEVAFNVILEELTNIIGCQGKHVNVETAVSVGNIAVLNKTKLCAFVKEALCIREGTPNAFCPRRNARSGTEQQPLQ